MGAFVAIVAWTVACLPFGSHWMVLKWLHSQLMAGAACLQNSIFLLLPAEDQDLLLRQRRHYCAGRSSIWAAQDYGDHGESEDPFVSVTIDHAWVMQRSSSRTIAGVCIGR